ncbi:hypothetical protein [Anatilimnocola floriformis]|uniref:hypothetical protein n=1 Tax=Anatilimnocola floriformis TaxID=2948575 RepID=UPI0020C4C0EA|nr:hypothetical protein [Anatilimnocola floriformis]
MGKKQTKPPEERADRPLPQNKQILERLLDTVQQYLKEQDAYIARQRIRLHQMRDCLTSPESALRNQRNIPELRDVAIRQASNGLADITIIEPYFLNGRIRELQANLARTYVEWADRRLDGTIASNSRFEQLLALTEEFLAEYRAFRDRLVAKLQNKRADNNSDMHKKIARIIPDDQVFMAFYRELEQRQGESSQRRIALDFTGGNETRADSMLRQYRRFKVKLAEQVRADIQKTS